MLTSFAFPLRRRIGVITGGQPLRASATPTRGLRVMGRATIGAGPV
jgi:hypothetical protein